MATRVLNQVLTRVYRGHLYGRKPGRKLRAQREATSWGSSEWEVCKSMLCLYFSASDEVSSTLALQGTDDKVLDSTIPAFVDT